MGTLPMTGLGADIVIELVGNAAALTSATFKTGAGSPEGFHAGDHIVWFVERFAPDSLALVINDLMRGSCSGSLESSGELADRTISVYTGRSDEALPGDQTMSIVIRIST